MAMLAGQPLRPTFGAQPGLSTPSRPSYVAQPGQPSRPSYGAQPG